MPLRSFTRYIVLPLALITPAMAAAAQQPAPLRQPESIPFDVAAALISSGGFAGEPQVLVGSMPEWIANRVYVPSNARILGSAFLGTTVVTVISLPTVSDSAIPEFTRELAKLGWKAPPPLPNYGGGFRPAPAVAEGSSTRATLCGDQQILSLSSARRRGIVTDVTLRVSAAGQYSACKPPQMPLGMPRSPYPTLYNPAGAAEARMTTDCPAADAASAVMSTTLRTATTPDALLDHYARQLQDSGWKSGVDAKSVVSRSWTRPDSTGTPVELSLTVTSTSRNTACRDISLQVRRAQKP
jgi:hypothetical protein